MMSDASDIIPLKIASSVAVSQACRATRMSIFSSGTSAMAPLVK